MKQTGKNVLFVMKFSTRLFGVNGISPKIILITLKANLSWVVQYICKQAEIPPKRYSFSHRKKTCRIVSTLFLQNYIDH